MTVATLRLLTGIAIGSTLVAFICELGVSARVGYLIMAAACTTIAVGVIVSVLRAPPEDDLDA